MKRSSKNKKVVITVGKSSLRALWQNGQSLLKRGYKFLTNNNVQE